MIPPKPFRLGDHLWARCPDCGKYVKLTGWGRGWHLCGANL
jgi:hypothetical protein